MRIHADEIFWSDRDSAACARPSGGGTALGNDSDYGVTSAVFSREIARALQVAQQIDAGMYHINGRDGT